jgi:DNA-binding transcriptional regulator YiaG
MYEYPNCGFGVRLENGYQETATAQGRFVEFSDLAGLHVAIARALIGHKRRLTKEEFRFLRKELEISQRELGALLEVGEQTISLWERGQHDIPKLPEVALRALVADRISVSAREPLKCRLQLSDAPAPTDVAPMYLRHSALGWEVASVPQSTTSTINYVVEWHTAYSRPARGARVISADFRPMDDTVTHNWSSDRLEFA